MADLPRGTVTFLFTDIEGSTERWERDPQAMEAAVQRHLVIIGGAVRAHGGVHFKTVGDALQAAFPTAPQALAATLDAQRALLAEDWGAIGGLSVRMALHAGPAVPDERGDYLAAPLNRLSRLLSTGHGGQILLTQAAQQLTRESMPPGSNLRDLGEHRLRDLIESERIFHLLHPELPSQFPPLKSLDYRPNNLPRQPTPFFGREREVREIVDLMRRGDIQLLTLTGPGGTGKTRLAMQAAAELLDDVPDGVFQVELAPLAEPDLVPPAIATALGLRELGDRTPMEAVIAFLRDRELLLVLDNFEHLLDAAPIVGALLAACPRVEVLATSRAPLHVRAERHYPVPPLGLPKAGVQAQETAAPSEAVQFFTERAQAANPAFAPSPDALPIIAAIVRRLDGLPLAIELAAARVRLLPPAALLARLDQSLPLLTGGARDAPARQQTLRGAIAWSHDLLSDDERALFRRMAVFAGGFSLEAADAVTSPEVGLDVLSGIESLVDHSLLRQGDAIGVEPRFAMLETINDYALERLAESDEETLVRDRHARYFLSLAEAANTHRVGAEEGAWHDRLELEYPNVRAALQWALDAHDGELLVLLAGALGDFWTVRAHHREGMQWLERALLAGEASTAARLRCLHRASLLAYQLGQYRRSTALAEDALALARQDGAPKEIADAQRRLGQAYFVDGDLQRSPPLLEEALAWHRGTGDAFGAASALQTLAEIAGEQGNYGLSRSLAEESMDTARAAGNVQGVANGLYHLASLAMAEGDGDRAIDLLQDAADRWQQAGTTAMVNAVRVELGRLIADHLGDDVRAEVLLDDALIFWQEVGHSEQVEDVLDVLGGIAAKRGDLALAESRYREALALCQATEDPLVVSERAVRAEVGLGRVACARGDTAQALQFCRAGLERLLAIPPEQWRNEGPTVDWLKNIAASCLRLTASVAASTHNAERAARILGAAAALEPAALAGMQRAEHASVEDAVASVRNMLSEDDFARAFADGQTLSVADAIASAVALTRDAAGQHG